MAEANAAAGAQVGEALRAAIDSFSAAGIDTPRLDAEVLLSEIAGVDRAGMIADPRIEIEPSAARAFSEAVRRRLRGEPVAYIVGHKGFRYIDLVVDERVLIPRPETEMLVELALEVKPSKMLEIGVGSGAVSLAVADEIPGCEVVATDISADALAVARLNAGRLDLDPRVTLLEATYPEPGHFDLLLTNLPYVGAGDPHSAELIKWEPETAIVPGETGLELIEEVVGGLAGAGVSTDVIGLEVGIGQADPVAGILVDAGFPATEIRDDLAGIPRIVIGRS